MPPLPGTWRITTSTASTTSTWAQPRHGVPLFSLCAIYHLQAGSLIMQPWQRSGLRLPLHDSFGNITRLKALILVGCLGARYGVPGCAADAFEEVAQKQVYARALQAEGKRGRDACDGAHKAILGKTTMFCPKLLLNASTRLAPSCLIITQSICSGLSHKRALVQRCSHTWS